MEKGFIGKLYTVCEWIMRIAYLNVLWILFTFAGLGLFGLVPSTIAMYAVTRKWVMGNEDIRIFHTFWDVYRKGFLKSQKFGLVLACVTLLLIVDYKFYIGQSSSALLFAKVFWVGCVVLFGTFVFYIIPFYVHFECRPMEYVKNVLLVAVMYPVHSVMIWCGAIFMILFIYNFPGFSPFLSGSVFALWTTFITHQIFSKLKIKPSVQEGKSLSVEIE